MAGHAEHGVVALGPARGRVDEGVDGLVEDGGGRGLVEHGLDVGGLEDLLVRVEGQAGELALDEVGAVLREGRVTFPARAGPAPTYTRADLHDGLELDVAVGALPAGDEVEHVHARRRPAVLDALAARELHADGGEEREARDLVPHAQEPRVEVDLRGQRGDGEQARVADEQEGRDRLVEEARLHVGRLLQHDEVPAGALGGGDLPARASDPCLALSCSLTLSLSFCAGRLSNKYSSARNRAG